jgi:hypothetical protein
MGRLGLKPENLHLESLKMEKDVITATTPVAVIRGLGIYEITCNGKDNYPVRILDGSMGELGHFLGMGCTLNDALELAVDYIESRNRGTSKYWQQVIQERGMIRKFTPDHSWKI